MITEVLFPTVIYRGSVTIDSKTFNDYKKWIEVEKLITPPPPETTTHCGYQRVFGPSDKMPLWLDNVMLQLSEILDELSLPIKSSWVVSYEAGGFQDPHIHSSSKYTLIVNILGIGDLLLFDPRPIAVALTESFAKNIILNPGDWIVFPGTLSHSSRPCIGTRDILVIDFK
jgi:hypothetical protein